MSIGRRAGWLMVVGLLSAAGCATKFKSAQTGGAGTGFGAMPGTTAAPAATSTVGTGSGAGGSPAQATGGGGTAGVGQNGSPPVGSAAGSGGGTQVPTNPSTQLGGAGASGSSGAAGTPAPPQTCPATSTLKPGDSMGSVQVGSTTRSYLLHVPSSYTGMTPVPLVTDWHGILLNASLQQQFSGYQQKADKEGFIVAYPDGIDTAWNVGWCCTTSKDVDDVGFARALVAKLEQQACIDPKRIYAVGYSMGGGMSMKLGCDAADLIAAIAPAAFDLMTDDAPNHEWPCHPSRPVTIIAFRSTSDPIVPYTGGPTSPPNGLPITVDFLGAEANFKKWAQLDGCTGSPAAGSNGCQTYSQCQGGAEVTLCTTQGGSHDYGDPDIGWDTLKRHSLP